MNTRPSIRLWSAAALLLCCCSSALIVCPQRAYAGAVDIFWTGEAMPDEDYNNPLNWNTLNVPFTPEDLSVLENAVIGDPNFLNPAMATLQADPPSVFDFVLARDGASASMQHTSGELVVRNEFAIAAGLGNANGVYELFGDGSIVQIGGISQRFAIAGGAESMMNEGQLIVDTLGMLQTQNTIIGNGDGGNGALIMSNGIHTAARLSLGAHIAAVGAYDMSGGQLNVDQALLTIGENGDGVMTLSGDANLNVNSPGTVIGRNFNKGPGPQSFGNGLLEVIGGNVNVDLTNLAFGHECDPGGISISCNPSDAQGAVRFVSDGAVSPINVHGDLLLNNATLLLDFETDPLPPGDVLLIALDGERTGVFLDEFGKPLLEGDVVPNSGGRVITYNFGAVGVGQGGFMGDIGVIDSSLDFDADFDKDGDVDGADFLIWQENFGGNAATPNDGDANGDGLVDGEDFLIWQKQFAGMSGSGRGRAVPEPSAFSVLLLMAAGLTRLGRTFKVLPLAVSE